MPTLDWRRTAFLGLQNDHSDALEHTTKVGGDVRIPEAKNGYATRRKPCTAFGVLARDRIFGMLATIKIDNKPQRRTVEVEHITAGRMLAPEFKTLDLSTSKPLP